MFIDSDDYLSCNDALSSIDEKLDEDKPDVLIFGSVINYKNSKDVSVKKVPLIPKKKDEKKKYQLTKKILRFVWPLCIKKELLDTYNIRFQEDIDLYEDTIFRTQSMAYSKKIRTYSKICYNYNRRLNKASLSSDANEKLTNKLSKLIKATRRIDELASLSQVPPEQIKDFKKTMLLFFPGIAIMTGNHLLSKLITKIPDKDFDTEKEI